MSKLESENNIIITTEDKPEHDQEAHAQIKSIISNFMDANKKKIFKNLHDNCTNLKEKCASHILLSQTMRRYIENQQNPNEITQQLREIRLTVLTILNNNNNDNYIHISDEIFEILETLSDEAEKWGLMKSWAIEDLNTMSSKKLCFFSVLEEISNLNNHKEMTQISDSSLNALLEIFLNVRMNDESIQNPINSKKIKQWLRLYYQAHPKKSFFYSYINTINKSSSMDTLGLTEQTQEILKIISETDEELALEDCDADFTVFVPAYQSIFETDLNLEEDNNLEQKNSFKGYLETIKAGLMDQSEHNQKKLDELIEIIGKAQKRHDLEEKSRVLAIASKAIEVYGSIRQGMNNFLGIKIPEVSNALRAIRKIFSPLSGDQKITEIHHSLYKANEEDLAGRLDQKINDALINEVLNNTKNNSAYNNR